MGGGQAKPVWVFSCSNFIRLLKGSEDEVTIYFLVKSPPAQRRQPRRQTRRSAAIVRPRPSTAPLRCGRAHGCFPLACDHINCSCAAMEPQVDLLLDSAPSSPYFELVTLPCSLPSLLALSHLGFVNPFPAPVPQKPHSPPLLPRILCNSNCWRHLVSRRSLLFSNKQETAHST